MSKEKIYDFGRLGKWSKSTLNANKTFSPMVLRMHLVKRIEDDYHKEYKAISTIIKELEHTRIFFMKLYKISVMLKNLSVAKGNLAKLIRDYDEYVKVMDELHLEVVKNGKRKR